jgi:hypothetical protein
MVRVLGVLAPASVAMPWDLEVGQSCSDHVSPIEIPTRLAGSAPLGTHDNQAGQILHEET